MQKLTINSSFNDICTHLQSLNFESFRFQITNDSMEKTIEFVNFCSLLSVNMIAEVKTQVFVPESNLRISKVNLNWNADLATFEFDLSYLDNINNWYKTGKHFFLGQYNETSSRKKSFISLYNSHRPTNLVEKFFLPDQNLEIKLIAAVIKTLQK
jgi:hypothetical protein